ncbi:MAG: hypothetical protein J0M26_09590 [Planctomycetes bacterium]|nr:hypothetical protein [Planctomycetota bacterium]
MPKQGSFMKWGLFTGIGGLAIGLGWLSWMNYTAGERVTEMREEIVKAGYPIHLKDLYKDSVPDQDNAYVEFQKWKDEISAADIAVSGNANTQPPFLSEPVLSPEEINELAAIIASHQVMIDEIVQAAHKKQLRVPLNIDKVEEVLQELLDRSQEFRSIARVLSANVRLKIAQGKQNEAMASAIAILKWSQLIAKQPTLVSYLVATAVRGIGIHYAAEVLYAGPVDEASLKNLEEVLLAFDTNAQWKSVVYSEIPFFVDVFHPTVPAATRHFWFSLNSEADYLYTMKTVAEKQLIQDGVFVTAMPNKDSDFGKSWMFASIMPAMNATQEATMRVEAQTRCLLALLQWRRQGGTAEDIKQLNLSGAWAKDPYDGGSLKFQTSEFGPILYVIGNNRVDDGGGQAIMGQQKDVGLLPLAMQAKFAKESE